LPSRTLKISLKGHDLIREPLLNKGSAFSEAERRAFALEGLLPQRTIGIVQQATRLHDSIARFDDPLEKYIALAALQDRNEHLYHYMLVHNLEEYLPIVYTPTVGLATKRFSHVFQRGRGVWITPDLSGRMDEILVRGARGREIRLIVATDNESVLGIGDQGAGGMAIAIGKLALYSAGAGIDPATVLPVSLDVGTDNEELLNDPMYLGWPDRRLRGADYDGIVAEFVAAVKKVFPRALVQWEDFRKDNGLKILARYRDELPSFNDDIQGTGAVALAAMLGAERIHGRALCDERVVILGAGAAGLGIHRQIRAAMAAAGRKEDELRPAIAVLDSRGLLVDDGSVRDGYKAEMAWPPELAGSFGFDSGQRGLEKVCEILQPTVLIGTSGQRGAFTEKAIRAIAAAVDRPVVLPLSNPTDQSEALPGDIYAWTSGRALVATGSPFPDVDYGGKKYRVGQGNNAFIFPGIGLGALASGAAAVTDAMFSAAAESLAAAVSERELESGLLFPPVSRLREVSAGVAAAVMRCAAADGLCAKTDDTERASRLKAMTWEPVYPKYVPAD